MSDREQSQRSSEATLMLGIEKIQAASKSAPPCHDESSTMFKAKPTFMRDPDDALRLLGSPGRFYYFQFLALCLQFSTLIMADLIPIFYNIPPQDIQCVAENWTFSEETSSAIEPLESGFHLGNPAADYCHCNGSLTYTYNGNQTSVIGDMNLICEKAPLASLVTTLYYVGCAIAGPIVGWLSDEYGRRPVLLSGCLTFVAVNVSLIFAKDFLVFAGLRFVAGIARVAVASSTFVLLMEWTPVSRRTVVAAASEFFFPTGVIALATCAYYFQQWRQIQLALAISNALFILNIWFAPESIQWLLVDGRVHEAVATLRTIARVNGQPVHRHDVEQLERLAVQIEDREASEHRFSIVHCFRDPQIRKFTLLISVLWFSTNFGYSGLSFLMDSLSPAVQADLAIGGALEMIPCAVATIIAIKCGKKYPIAGFLLTAGLLAITTGFISNESRLRVFLALSARMSLVGSYCLMFMYAAELFPTAIRSSGFGVGFFFFMVGGMLSPQLTLLNNGYIFSGTPVITIGAISLIGAMAVLALPEKAQSSYQSLK